jgi:hypothetical protein
MGARGVRTIEVDGREITILFTNRALMSVEKQIGKGIIGFLNGFTLNSVDIGINDMVAFLRAGMEAARQDSRKSGKPVSNDDALDIIDQIGITAVIVPVMEAVAEVVSYNSQAESVEQGKDPN